MSSNVLIKHRKFNRNTACEWPLPQQEHRLLKKISLKQCSTSKSCHMTRSQILLLFWRLWQYSAVVVPQGIVNLFLLASLWHVTICEYRGLTALLHLHVYHIFHSLTKSLSCAIYPVYTTFLHKKRPAVTTNNLAAVDLLCSWQWFMLYKHLRHECDRLGRCSSRADSSGDSCCTVCCRQCLSRQRRSFRELLYLWFFHVWSHDLPGSFLWHYHVRTRRVRKRIAYQKIPL